MPNSSKSSAAGNGKNTTDSSIEQELNTETATHLEIAHDWQTNLAMKNAAILKSIEDLIDAAFNSSSES